MIKKVSREFFSAEVSVDVIDRKKETGVGVIGKSEEEHVTFKIRTINDANEDNKSTTSLSSAVVNVDYGNSNLALSLFDFTIIFPYHVCFDRLLVVEHCGLQIQKHFPDVTPRETMLFDLFEFLNPDVPLNFQNIIRYINSTFVAKLKLGNFFENSEDYISVKGTVDPISEQ